MAAINGPGDQLRQPQVIRADQLLGGMGYCTTDPPSVGCGHMIVCWKDILAKFF